MKHFDQIGEWISTEVIEVIKHNLNFSNWTETYACIGKWKVTVNTVQGQKIEIFMPTARWGEEHSGFWKLYSGSFEVKDNELLIWQNEETPVSIKFHLSDSNFSLEIFGRIIEFTRV